MEFDYKSFKKGNEERMGKSVESKLYPHDYSCLLNVSLSLFDRNRFPAIIFLMTIINAGIQAQMNTLRAGKTGLEH